MPTVSLPNVLQNRQVFLPDPAYKNFSLCLIYTLIFFIIKPDVEIITVQMKSTLTLCTQNTDLLKLK
jgi:hypothetical protein